MVELARALFDPQGFAATTVDETSTPTFHNPLGTTTSLAHRRALLAIAARAGKPVIEDACEMDLRFEGRGAPPLAARSSTRCSRASVRATSRTRCRSREEPRRRRRGAQPERNNASIGKLPSGPSLRR